MKQIVISLSDDEHELKMH